MAHYRKRPVVIQAVQLCTAIDTVDPEPEDGEVMPCPTWFREAYVAGRIVINPSDKTAIIETLEGTHRAQPRDWIILGVHGEIYPCKPEIFSKTYEPA